MVTCPQALVAWGSFTAIFSAAGLSCVAGFGNWLLTNGPLRLAPFGTACGDVRPEVSRQHSRRGNKFGLIAGSLTSGGALVTGEEEQLVLLDWAADHATKQVSLELVIGSCKKIAPVQVFRCAGTRINRRGKRSCQTWSPSSLQHPSVRHSMHPACCDQPKFLEGIREWQRQRKTVIRVDMANSVERVVG